MIMAHRTHAEPLWKFYQRRAEHWYAMAREATEPAQITGCERKGDQWEQRLQAELERVGQSSEFSSLTDD